MPNEFDTFTDKLIVLFNERQRTTEDRLRESFTELRTDFKQDSIRLENATKEISTSVHNIDMTLAQIRGEKLPEKIDGHEKRISNLENWRSYILGAIAILVAVVTYLVNKFLK